MNLSNACVTERVANAAAAAQTDVTSDAVDMRGFKACQFVVAIGTVAATGTVIAKIQQSDDDGDTDAYSDLSGATAAADADDDNGLLVIDVAHPRKRYLQCVVTRGTADSSIDAIVAQKYLAEREPVTAAAVATTFAHAPAES